MFKKKYLAVAGLMALAVVISGCGKKQRLYIRCGSIAELRSADNSDTDAGDSSDSYPYTGADKYGRSC